MTPDEIKKKIDDLQKRTDAVATKKAQFGGQLQAKKEELAALIKEIKAAGYDPKTLVGERDKAKAELEQMLGEYESDLTKTESAFSAYEKK
jgi:chromosome segregation ATPase